MNDKINKLKKIIRENDNIIFFGGAGVSTESGIPDFRSVDGIYNMNYKYPPEVIISHSFFKKNTSEFYRFYKDKMVYLDAKPNEAHYYLANLEKKGKLRAVITQNIDGLHQKAGSKNVLELHGSIYRNKCIRCQKKFDIEYIMNHNDVPRCSCGGIIKPDVVLYEESLDYHVMSKAIEYISSASVLIIGGTSLLVYPAAGFVNYFKGKELVIINKDKLKTVKEDALILNEQIGEVFKRIKE